VTPDKSYEEALMVENRTAELATPGGPLAGVRILDLTSVVFGPYATQILGDLGADVIKVEGPAQNEKGEGGDTMRYAGATPTKGFGPIFMGLNRNKRSVYLDLSQPESRERMGDLIASADVFVSNVRMNSLGRLGLDYETVAAIKPDIIYAHASGYDSDGPDAGKPAYDDLIQARSGMTDLLSRGGGGDRPRYLPSLIADKVSGLFLSQAILAALYHRKSTGQGQFVEVPMLESMTSFTLVEHFFSQVFDPPQGDWGYRRVLSEHRQPFQTLDGYVAMLPYTTEQWDRIFEFFGQPGAILENPKFSTFQARTKHIEELYAALAGVAPNKTTAEWLDLLERLGVPHAAVNRLNDLQSDAQLESVGLFERHEHPSVGAYFAVRSPLKFTATPTSIHRHPPGLGEHTDEVLGELAKTAAGGRGAAGQLARPQSSEERPR
jgi:crotonobetainyl-CoA:carnitine CoA-transferase CaiB-like acyl-CoA transferase